MPQSNGLLACAIASDGRWVATTSTDNTVAVRDLRSKEMVATLYGHELLAYPYFGTFGCAFSPRGKLLVSAGGDKTLSLWTTENWKKAGTLSGHEDRVMACVFSPDGKTVISAGFDHTVRSWDVDRLSQVLVLKDHRGPVYCCAVSPDGRTLLSGGGGGIVTKDFKVRLWDARNGDLIAALAGHRAPVRACAFTPDGVYFVTAGEDGIFRVWESAGGKSAAEIDLGGKLHRAAIHPWRLHAGCGDQGGNFQLLDLLGIESGPIVITAHDLGGGPRFRCPACGSVAGARREWLGAVIACPSRDCGQSLRLNPFLFNLILRQIFSSLFAVIEKAEVLGPLDVPVRKFFAEFYAGLIAHQPARLHPGMRPARGWPGTFDDSRMPCLSRWS